MNRRGTSVLLLVLSLLTSTAVAAEPLQPPKAGWVNQFPVDRVQLDPGRRNPLFYVGDAIEFDVKGPPADRYEVRDYWGEVIEQGKASAKLQLKAQPPGWYKLYVFGKPLAKPKVDSRTVEEKELVGDNTKEKAEQEAAAQNAWQYRDWYGDCVGATTFIIVRNDPNFPKLPSLTAKFPQPGTGDEVIRGVCGIGPQRHSVPDAAKPEEAIKSLEQEIAADHALYLPFDPERHRALMIAFPNGTKGKLDGLKKIVEHFKNDVKYYEPRNEPNFGASAPDFVKNELVDFYQAVKSVDPSLKVLGPGAVSINPGGGLLGWNEEFLKADGAKYIDGYSFHFYNGLNGDLWMGRTSLDALTALLKKYNASDKELWQTEQGYFACVYGDYQPRIQGRWTMMEIMLFEQYGLTKEHNHLWYDVSHGFWDVPTWWENDDRGFNPAAPLMRVWSEELFGKHFTKRLDFGTNGNRLYVGSVFEGDKKQVAAFMSDGVTDGEVDLKISGGAPSVHLVSAFGVEKDLPVTGGVIHLPVPEIPVYVELGADQKLEVVAQDYGVNLARAEGVKLTSSGMGPHPVDPKIPNDIGKIVNGEFEDWYYTQQPQSQPWMDGTREFPAWVEIAFAKPTDVGRVITYAPAPWQWQGTPTDFELQYDDGGKWVTLAKVNEPLKSFKVLTPATRTKVDSFFSDRHTFDQSFPPVKTTKIRLFVRNTTFGGGATKDVADAGGQTGPHQLMLREVEVYAK